MDVQVSMNCATSSFSAYNESFCFQVSLVLVDLMWIKEFEHRKSTFYFHLNLFLDWCFGFIHKIIRNKNSEWIIYSFILNLTAATGIKWPQIKFLFVSASHRHTRSVAKKNLKKLVTYGTYHQKIIRISRNLWAHWSKTIMDFLWC